MRLERFMILSYGFLMCFISLAAAFGTLVTLVLTLTQFERSGSSPGRQPEFLTDEEFARRYPDVTGKAKPQEELHDHNGNLIAAATTTTGDRLDRIAVEQRTLEQRVRAVPLDLRLEILRRGEIIGYEKAANEWHHRLRVQRYAVHATILVSALLIFAFHWRWLQVRLDAMRPGPEAVLALNDREHS